MTTIELARMVRSMRIQQKAYFRTRSEADLQRSKELEKELDQVVQSILDDRPALLPGMDQ